MRRVLLRVSISLVVLIGAAGFTARALLLASLPRERGVLTLAGLRAPVEVLRDDRGVAVLRAPAGGDLLDLSRALGFVHAQERFFQMDLMRRDAAGELAELVGSAGLERDERARKLRLRVAAAGALEHLPAAHRARLDAYAQGVNAGLGDLPVRPPEYLALATSPEPWTSEDSLLCALAMFKELSLGARAESVVDRLAAGLPPEVVAFLTPEFTRFDAPPLARADEPAYRPAPVPGPEIIDLRTPQAATTAPPLGRTAFEDPEPIGSNNWAIGPSKSRDGRAIVAGDMHLALSAPNIWYRAQLEWGGRRAAGVTLPGIPSIVAGSNGSVAWAFTNVGGDFEDYIVVEPDPTNPTRYLTPDGPAQFGEVIEEIPVRGAPVRRLALRTTIWGPVIDSDAKGRPLVLKWIATEPGGLNLAIFDLLEARTADEALAIAGAWRGPPQNVVIADSDGRLAYTVSGMIPRREGFDGSRPVSWAEPGVGWGAEIDASERPTLKDPADGVLFSANNRTLPATQSRMLGRSWALGERAGRISSLLRDQDRLTEPEMLALQLDTRVGLFDFYKGVALTAVPESEPDEMLREARRLIGAWNGCADEDQPGFRILALFRARLSRAIFGAITRPCRELDRKFTYSWFQSEEPLRRILEERPAHLLPPSNERAATWDAFLRAELRAAATDGGATAANLSQRTWGGQNRSRIRHPLSLAAPILGLVLDLPQQPQSGAVWAVRVQTPSFGASQRLVVSPGHEDEGLLHMPAGQSGHFLSRHYSDGQEDWRLGRPTPLLAGPPVSSLRLVPAGEPAR